MSMMICFCSNVACFKHVFCCLDLVLIVAPLFVTLKIAGYSYVISYVRFRNSVLFQSRHHIQILEDQMSDWIILRARWGVIVEKLSTVIKHVGINKNNILLVSSSFVKLEEESKELGKLLSDQV